MIKNGLQKITPAILLRYWRRFRKFLIAFVQYWYDGKRFFRYSSMLVTVAPDFKRLEAQITAHYHVIEKGLSLQEPRLGFGQSEIEALLKRLQVYMSHDYPDDNVAFRTAISALNQYVFYHEEHDYDVAWLKDKLIIYEAFAQCDWGGVQKLAREDILQDASIAFVPFIESRHSIRNFSTQPVDVALIEKAISMAQKSPSVCNRQSTKVYIISDDILKNKVLQLQAGNRGFGHLVNKALIITSDIRSFFDIDERNQAFIDGGLFSMSLLYGLHAIGLGACPLNWAVVKEQDLRLRKLTGIAENENIIMLVAVGHLPEQLNVAKSQRRALNEMCVYL